MTEAKTKTLKVLIIDDEEGMCRGIEKSLRNTHFIFSELQIEVELQLTIGFSLAEMRSLMGSENSPYDLLILDHQLTDGRGIEAIPEILKLSHPPIVIVSTAYATFDVAVQAIKVGAYDFISKPFTPAEIREVIKKASQYLVYSREALALMEEKRKIKFEFVSVLSHELKSPLNAIEGYLHLLKDRLTPQQISEGEMIARSLVRIGGMRKLIFDLLDLTRIESGLKKRELTSVDLSALIRQVVEQNQLDLEKNKLRMEMKIPESCPFTGDVQELEMIFQNLISNAIKYNRQGGLVRVELSENATSPESDWVLMVQDTGIGISDKDQKKLFKDFSRIKNDQTHSIPGSGLGLSTVQKIVEVYRGKIKLTSEIEKGTSVCIQLPKQELTKEVAHGTHSMH